MASSPVHFAAAFLGRSVAPMIYANPFSNNLLTWIGDPSNTWNIMSYLATAIVAASAVWLIHGATSFFKKECISAVLATVVVIGLSVILMEGNKFDPLDWKQATAAMLFILAFFSVCGRYFSYTEDQKDKNK